LRSRASLAASQPPAVAAAMAPLLEAPLSELGRALASFALPPSDSKPDLLHWLPLLNRLDQWLEGCAARADAGLRGVASADEPFPTEEAVAVLRASAALLDCSHNRHLYGSTEVRARLCAARAGGSKHTGPRCPPCVAALTRRRARSTSSRCCARPTAPWWTRRLRRWRRWRAARRREALAGTRASSWAARACRRCCRRWRARTRCATRACARGGARSAAR
jgi:hypothetical protein